MQVQQYLCKKLSITIKLTIPIRTTVFEALKRNMKYVALYNFPACRIWERRREALNSFAYNY